MSVQIVDDPAYVYLPPDALKALPAVLRAAGFVEAAEKVDEQLKKDNHVRAAYIEAASDIYSDEGTVEIDDNAIVSDSEDGAYVMAWCWVYKSDAGLEAADEDVDAAPSRSETLTDRGHGIGVARDAVGAYDNPNERILAALGALADQLLDPPDVGALRGDDQEARFDECVSASLVIQAARRRLRYGQDHLVDEWAFRDAVRFAQDADIGDGPRAEKAR